jgi:DNA-binding transcriptional LysR family regulator
LELRQLRHFLAVVEGGSLGDAARQLQVSQPSLTKSIQALERSVGGALFERSVQGMRPTALGRCLEIRARVIAGEVGRAEREIHELLGAQRGKVVIGTGPSFAHAILPIALARFYKTHPAIEVTVIDGLLGNVLPLVKTGAIDYAFYVAPDHLAEDDLVHEVLLPRQRISVVTSAGNPLAAKHQVSAKEIWSQPWTLPIPPDYIREKLEMRFQQLGLPPPRPVVEYSSIYAAKSILRDGNFVALFMNMLVEDEIRRKDLCLIDVPEMTWEVDHGAIYRRDVLLSPAAQQLLEEIRAVCAERR